MQTVAMAYAGACGQTADQMAAVIKCDLPQSELHAALGDLQADLLARANDTTVLTRTIRPAVCPSPTRSGESRPIPSARRTLRSLTGRTAPDCTRPTLRVLPMRREHRSTLGSRSKRRIAFEDIVPEDAITANTRLVLANAVWFADDWAEPFDAFYTRDDAFFLPDGGTISVPFMAREGRMPYARGDGFHAIDLAYAGSGFGFTVIVPDEGRYDAVEAHLTVATFTAVIEQLRPDPCAAGHAQIRV